MRSTTVLDENVSGTVSQQFNSQHGRSVDKCVASWTELGSYKALSMQTIQTGLVRSSCPLRMSSQHDRNQDQETVH